MLRTLLVVFSLLFFATAFSQPCLCDRKVVKSKDELRSSVAANPSLAFVSLPQYIPGIVLDVRYATSNNFTGHVLYPYPAAWLRTKPAEALKKVQEELAAKGLGLKIYDAYRPFTITCSLWRYTTDRHYTASPRKGSHHNRGLAVDITIIDLKTGKELPMGTGYDNFTDSAHHAFTKLPADVLANRRLLKGLMWKHGFNFIPTEWWHYHWRDKNYDVLDMPFDDLADAMRSH